MSRKVTVTISAGDANNPRAILDEVLKALREKQVEVTIAVEPPDPAPTREQAVEQYRAGQALELDDAFAQVAGVSKDEWAARVAAHRPPPAAGG